MTGMFIRESAAEDFPQILAIINDAAEAYRGVIPPDRWHDPYMPAAELEKQIDEGVQFSVAEEEGRMLGVMGIQDRGDVALVRHAYVSTTIQRGGVGTKLLHHVLGLTHKPVLIGTWTDASWAIGFYQRHGFELLPRQETTQLLRKYWSIPDRQVETSIVLADRRWLTGAGVGAG